MEIIPVSMGLIKYIDLWYARRWCWKMDLTFKIVITAINSLSFIVSDAIILRLWKLRNSRIKTWNIYKEY